MDGNFEAVIGLEVHAQLLTKTKLFCSCKNNYGVEPNTLTCPVCLGFPGSLPVLNKQAVEYTMKMGIATHCTITKISKFARKNYFYPDLPKGYQISQYDDPLCTNGYIIIGAKNSEKRIGITRIHLEEDAGKSIHSSDAVSETKIDFNRCGVPLIEIVSEPDIRTPEESYAYLKELIKILKYLRICNCNMEKGNLRCDVNLSLRQKDSKQLGVKTEIKNLNSLHGVKIALEHEIMRQSNILDKGDDVKSVTMLWDDDRRKVDIMRIKEQADDYRYFIEPDLAPIMIDEDWINELEKSVPEQPRQRYRRFLTDYGLSDSKAEILSSDPDLADYFENLAELSGDSTLSANWIIGEVLRVVNDLNLEIARFPITYIDMAELLILFKEGKITKAVSKEVMDEMLSSDQSAKQIIENRGLFQLDDESQLKSVIESTIEQNSDAVNKYREGKMEVLGFLIGQVKNATRGRADPKLTASLLKKILEE